MQYTYKKLTAPKTAKKKRSQLDYGISSCAHGSFRIGIAPACIAKKKPQHQMMSRPGLHWEGAELI